MIDAYKFLDTLSRLLADDDIVIPDCGANLIQTFQAFHSRHGQRVFSAFNNSPMGYSLSGAIGAAFAFGGKRRIICITGDGGLQVNMQELGTVALHKLPIKIFLMNNHGYGIIQQTQEDWLDGRLHGARPETGLDDPDYMALADAFGLSYLNIRGNAELRDKLRQALMFDAEPLLCEIDLSPNQRIAPMLKAGRPIEDPMPLMDRSEFRGNMIVETL